MHKHIRERRKPMPGGMDKAIVLGMRERGGRTKALTVDGTDAATLEFAILDHVETGSTVHTDEWSGYAGLRDLDYTHETVNHRAGEYVRDDGVTTNSIEAVWAVLKRGIYGTFHHVSEKHLDRYVGEFAFRLNEGNVKRHTLDRLDSFVDGVAGKRLTYKALIG
jgi:hypothetical protein